MRRLVALVTLVTLSALALSASAGAVTPVAKSQRELLVISPGLAQGNPVERAFYEFVEFNALALATATLGTRYARVTILKGSAATATGFVSALDTIVARPGVRAVDMLFLTHGLTDQVVMHDGRVSVSELRTRIRLRLTLDERGKLRAVFSTACFGASHRVAWREAGFKAVSGSRKIYADSGSSYLPFLSAWGLGASFAASVTAANVAGAASTWDALAVPWLVANGKPELATQVDSFRLTAGGTGLTINTMP